MCNVEQACVVALLQPCSIELIHRRQRVTQFIVSQHEHSTRSLAMGPQAIKVNWRECGKFVNKKRGQMHVVKFGDTLVSMAVMLWRCVWVTTVEKRVQTGSVANRKRATQLRRPARPP